MIGIGQYIDDKWVHNCLTCSDSSPEAEFEIMKEFVSIVRQKKCSRIYYWSAEEKLWSSAERRQFDRLSRIQDIERSDDISDNWKIDSWCDLMDVFHDESIAVHGAFDYRLKSIAQAMNKLGMISTKLDSECKSGLSAMMGALQCYSSNENPIGSRVMKDIQRYNEFDCKVLSDIVNYLRDNH